MSEHDWFRDNVPVYSVRALPADEATRFERHAAECAACAQELARWRLFDQRLDRLCAPVRLADDFEDHAVAKFTAAQRPRLFLSATARWAAGIAALIMIGLLGAGVVTVAEQGFLTFPGGGAVTAEGFLGRFLSGSASGEETTTVLIAAKKLDMGDTLKAPAQMFVEKRVAKSQLPNGAINDYAGIKDRVLKRTLQAGQPVTADDLLADRDQQSLWSSLPAGHRAVGVRANPETIAGGFASLPNSRVDVISTVRRGDDRSTYSEIVIENVQVLAADTQIQRDETGRSMPANLVTLALRPEDALRLEVAKQQGTINLALRKFNEMGKSMSDLATGDPMSGKIGGNLQLPLPIIDGFAAPSLSKAEPSKARVSTTTETTGALIYAGADKDINARLEGLLKTDGDGKSDNSFRVRVTAEADPRAPGESKATEKSPVPVNPVAQPGMMPPSPTTTTHTTSPKVETKSEQKPGDDTAGGKDLAKLQSEQGAQMKTATGGASASSGGLLAGPNAMPPGRSSEGWRMKDGDNYFSLQTGKLTEKGQSRLPLPDDQNKTKEETKRDPEDGKAKVGGKSPDVGKEGDQQTVAAIAAQGKPEPNPQVAQRKIIRTGDIEFEVQAFDDAVAQVTKLISAIPGAFVATVNSEKLPNGKVRGSVVVRVPPEHLDRFVLDLRMGLAKAGELKSQRIGSQDVTKQYTDIESRLRAAKAMEERLIAIIKGGKGEIKDLLAAERELGIWRTKSEEMEGEIRYYNNQVSLSTLTITAYEKEIRAAAAMVVTEQVTMKIEADDVEKSLQAALQAVTEAKGRITKSDLKQHAAGQYEAILQFEVAPAAAEATKDKLRKLGVVTHHDAQRLTQAEGGTSGAAAEIKSRTSDVQFHVTLYNVANIQPRETHHLQVAVLDVPAEYGKLLEAVTAAKGQIRVSQLNEQEKLNTFAQLDFDVPSTQRLTFDKQMTTLGDVVSRNTTRAAPGETATDRKVGYRLMLKSIASIQARETHVLQIAVQDVQPEFHKLLDAVAAAKGQVRVSQLSEQDKLNISAQFDFDVPSAERATFDKQLAELGDVVHRNTLRAAPNEVSTERKVGYRLTLKAITSILARETHVLNVAVADVPAEFGKLLDAVATAKGQVRVSQLSEQDKLNISAQLDFDIPSAERGTIDKLLIGLGETVSRTTNRASPTEISTDRKVSYKLALKDVISITPRETFHLQAIALDVPAAYRKLQEAVTQAKGHVRIGQLNEGDKQNVTAKFDFDVPTAAQVTIDKLLDEIGDVFTRTTTRVQPSEIATDKKVGYRLSMQSHVPPRETIDLKIEVLDVDKTAASFASMVSAVQGKVRAAGSELDQRGQSVAIQLFDVPLSAKDDLVKRFKAAGNVRMQKAAQDLRAPDTKLATAAINVHLVGTGPIVPSNEGVWPQIRTSLGYSFRLLSVSLMFLVVGLCVLLPWALVLWVGVKVVRRMRAKGATA